MKKILFFPLVVLTLTSCKINWFGASYDVPWWAIVIPAAIILIISHICIIRTTFVCPKCENSFRPHFYEISAWIHMGNKRACKCQKCGYKGFCEKEK